MNEKEYRSHPAISRSELFLLTESPEKFKYYKEHPQPPTPALAFGQLLHAMALQPELVSRDFAVAPNVDRRTKQGKADYAAFLEAVGDKTIVDLEMVKLAAEMCDALKENNFVQKLFAGEKEKPFFWVDEMTGEECKCRADVITKLGEKRVIVDLKSAENGDTESFMRAAIKYGYDLQAAMYSEGVKQSTGEDHIFVFVVIEKKPPYAINILRADEMFLRRGYDLFRELIGTYHYCKTNDDWFGYMGQENMVNSLGLPRWLAKEVE